MNNFQEILCSTNSNSDLTNSFYNKLKWQFALENSNIGIWDYNAELDRVFYSKESKKIIGFSNDDDEFGTNPQDWNNRVHPEDREKYFQDFQDHFNGLKPIYENIHRVQCKDGTYKWISDKGKIIEWTEEGNPKRIIGTHIDITQQKENEQELADSLNLITEQNKKLKNFAFIVTHNLKSHAANFESLLEFFNNAETNTEKQELFEALNTVSHSLTNTISNLNEVVSIQTRKNNVVEKIHVNTYINNITALLNTQIAAKEGILNNNVPEDLYLTFNPAYFESIIQNLLSNAIKYKHPERKPIINLESTETNDFIIIKCIDNGIGIDLEKFGNDVFGLYKTFHKNKKSEGIGLYLTKNQVEAFGGTIEIESKVNIGTTFIITLPKTKNPA